LEYILILKNNPNIRNNQYVIVIMKQYGNEIFEYEFLIKKLMLSTFSEEKIYKFVSNINMRNKYIELIIKDQFVK